MSFEEILDATAVLGFSVYVSTKPHNYSTANQCHCHYGSTTNYDSGTSTGDNTAAVVWVATASTVVLLKVRRR